jgi:hypothetical protein
MMMKFDLFVKKKIEIGIIIYIERKSMLCKRKAFVLFMITLCIVNAWFL